MGILALQIKERDVPHSVRKYRLNVFIFQVGLGSFCFLSTVEVTIMVKELNHVII